MTGADLIEQIRSVIADKDGEAVTDRALVKRLGISVAGLANWKRRGELKAAQITRLMLSMERASERRALACALQPIVEFFELKRASYGANGLFRIFSVKDESGSELPYLRGLRDELDAHHGVYLFYDSRGRALYAGKARNQTLWTELNNAYNRDRGVQNILRVNHLQNRKDFRTSDEVTRQIRSANVRLHELAAYVSAYRVADEMIGNIESLLIRAFPNDLLNARIEKMAWD